MAFVGNDSDDSGNNEGAFNFVLVGNETDDAGNNEGMINTAIFPDAGEGNCEGPACVNFFARSSLEVLRRYCRESGARSGAEPRRELSSRIGLVGVGVLVELTDCRHTVDTGQHRGGGQDSSAVERQHGS